jgi:hypothetical protein
LVANMSIPTIDLGDGRTFEMRLGMIDSTMLGYEDHGIFTAQLMLDYGSSNQGAGGLFLDTKGEDDSDTHSTPYSKRRRGTAFGMDWIMRVMDTVGVEKWENLPGKRVYALIPPGDYLVRGLANIRNPEFRYLIFEDHFADFRREDGSLR